MLYFVNVFTFAEDQEKKPKDFKEMQEMRWSSMHYENHRCWGYFKDLEKAKKAVLENWTDMYEHGYYNAALIEGIPEGLCPFDLEEHWYSARFVRGENEQALEESTDGDVTFSLFGQGPADGPMRTNSDSYYVIEPMDKPAALEKNIHFSF